jgi:hypothetical protein
MCARLALIFANSFFHFGLNGVLGADRVGFKPLALTAAKKFVRILLKVFGVRPATAGVMAASLALIAGRSSGMRRAVDAQ